MALVGTIPLCHHFQYLDWPNVYSQCLAFDVLHRDVVPTIAGGSERVDHTDVGVAEGGRRAGFLLESRNAKGIVGEFSG